MPVDLKVTGAAELAALARRLKEQGQSGKLMRRDLLREIRKEARPAADDAKASIQRWSTPPEDRGLRQKIAAGIRVRTRLTGKRVGVRITVSKVDGTNLPRRINKGYWRHPVFGTDRWVVQSGKPGWFDSAIQAHARQVRRGVQRAMKRTAERIARG